MAEIAIILGISFSNTIYFVEDIASLVEKSYT